MPRLSAAMAIPLVTLAVLSVVGGLVELPPILGGLPLFSDFLHTILPRVNLVRGGIFVEWSLTAGAAAVSLAGILAAYELFLRTQLAQTLADTRVGKMIHRLWFAGWGFDWLDNEFIVRPFLWLTNLDKDDVIDLPYQGVAWLGRGAHRVLSLTQTGGVRWYAVGVVAGALFVVGLAVFL
jgi:NADH-quinone oxidoreductase subunit L